jgi:hypothetical protein
VASATKNLKKVQERLRNLQKERAKRLRIFYRHEPLIAGSYSEVFMRCGKATCRCHQKGGHFATRLSKWTRGKLKTKIVRVDDREQVREASDHYKSHKSMLREMKKLHAEELNMLKQIIELKTTEYE